MTLPVKVAHSALRRRDIRGLGRSIHSIDSVEVVGEAS